MRDKIDLYRKTFKLNFSLLATSGEYAPGRFCKLDSEMFKNDITEKMYYTNSFHVNVDSGMNPLEKIRFEGPFHNLCNGGCISYVELGSAPLNNTEAISDLIDSAIKNGISYFGINYPLDICNDCNNIGTFDNCSKCASENVKRIRRVSGYLEEYDYFTEGKKVEVINRKPNLN